MRGISSLADLNPAASPVFPLLNVCNADHLIRGLAGWQWLFIIEGAGSFFLGLVAILLLPDFPHSNSGAGKWLFNEAERELAQERIEADRVSDKESDHSIWYGLKLAAKDYRVWIFVSTFVRTA